MLPLTAQQNGMNGVDIATPERAAPNRGSTEIHPPAGVNWKSVHPIIATHCVLCYNGSELPPS